MFEIKVKYTKIDENGKEKNVTEPYLLDAVSFSDAEMRAYKELEKFVSGEFSVEAIKKSRYSEVLITGEGEILYKGKVIFIVLDENSGKEKKSAIYVIIDADNVDQAYNNLLESFSGVGSDFEIEGIQDSKIIDYWKIEE